MAYDYKKERPYVFSELGQVQFLAIRDNAKRLIDISGAATASRILQNQSGDSWQMLACIDRLVELGELIEIVKEEGWAQHRVFVRPE